MNDESSDQVDPTKDGAPLPMAHRVLTASQQAALARTHVRMAEGWPINAGKLDRDAAHER